MRKTILILEDDVDLAEGIELSLQCEELNFIICSTIADARKTIPEQKIDLIKWYNSWYKCILLKNLSANLF